jgi:hypothetical protein
VSPLIINAYATYKITNLKVISGTCLTHTNNIAFYKQNCEILNWQNAQTRVPTGKFNNAFTS